MRWVWFALLLALAPHPAPPEENNFAIEGTVVRLGTTEPLEGIEVTLIRPNANLKVPRTPELQAVMENVASRILSLPNVTSEKTRATLVARGIADGEKTLGLTPGTLLPPDITSVATDAAGKFAFRNLSPGPHTVRVQRDGYFGPFGTNTVVSRRVSVEADHASTRVEFGMRQGGMVSGRVLDPDGRPVAGVQVRPSLITYGDGLGPYVNGRGRLTPMNEGVRTDYRGEYWLPWLPPGKYYVEAAPPSDKEWVRTLFPNAKDLSTAALVTVISDVVIEGIDILFRPEESPLFTVSGIAVNPLHVDNTGNRPISSFLLAPREPGVMDPDFPPIFVNTTFLNENREFEIHDVRPGSYDLYAVYEGSFDSVESGSNISRFFFGRAPVEVRDEDVKDIQLDIRPGVDLDGRVLFNGSPGNPVGLRVFLRAQETMPRLYMKAFETIPVDSSGKFHAEHVPEGRLKLDLGGTLPEGAYVEDIRQGGRSVFDDGFFLYGRSETIEVVVNSRGLVVEGIVENSDQKPVPYVTVVLVPPEQQRRNASRYRRAITDESGKFSIKTVPPGIYTAYAWEGGLPTDSWLDDNFFSKYQGQGKIVNVVPNSRIQLQLLSIPPSEQ